MTLQYFDYDPSVTGVTTLPTQYDFNVWEAIIQISMAAYRLGETPSSVDHENTYTRFIAINCMNSVLSALTESTQAILDNSENVRQSNNQVFLILLFVVSGALGLSLTFLLPVIRKAQDNK